MVHHAGIYTLQDLKAGSIRDDVKNRVFRDSIVISTEDYHEMSEFLFEMAMNICSIYSKCAERAIRIRCHSQ